MTVLIKTPIVPSLRVIPDPYDGMTVIHDTTGRKIEYTYDGILGAWIPKRSFGTIQLYVDPLGTDDLDYGWGTGASAFQTVQYAWNSLPEYIDHMTTFDGWYSVRIDLGAGTYNENLVFLRNDSMGLVHIRGAMTDVSYEVATGGAIGAGAVPPRCSGVFLAAEGEGQMAYFTSGANNGLYRVIGKTTVANMYFAGNALNAAPINGDTYTIRNWGSIIAGGHTIGPGCNAFSFMGIQFNVASVGGSLSGILSSTNTWHEFRNCRFYNNDAVQNSVFTDDIGLIAFRDCFWDINGARVGCGVGPQGCIEIHGGKIRGNGAPSQAGLNLYSGAQVSYIAGVDLHGFIMGINMLTSAAVWHYANVNNFIHGNTIGVLCTRGAQYFGKANNTYGKELSGAADVNGTNENVSAATFAAMS